MDIYKILNKVQTKVSGSKEVDPKTMNQMRKMAEEIAGGRKRRILKQVAAAAIVLCIGGGVTVGAAGGFKDSILHKFLYFGEGTESAETSFSRMNQEDVLAGAKDKGIGVEVKQSISVRYDVCFAESGTSGRREISERSGFSVYQSTNRSQNRSESKRRDT